MTKVKLTKEQADRLGEMQEVHKNEEILNYHIRGGWSSGGNKVLNDLSTDEMARALYVGYEVEPTFRDGDWVVWSEQGSEKIVCKITGVCEECKDSLWTDYRGDNGVYQSLIKKSLRPASSEEIAEEKERRWWAKHGRDVNEYRVGDIIVECDGYFGVITELPKEYPSQERDDDMSDESNYYVKIDPDWRPCDYQTRHVEDLKLVCFVENRLDVKDDE